MAVHTTINLHVVARSNQLTLLGDRLRNGIKEPILPIDQRCLLLFKYLRYNNFNCLSEVFPSWQRDATCLTNGALYIASMTHTIRRFDDSTGPSRRPGVMRS